MSVRKRYTNKQKTKFYWEYSVDIPSDEYDAHGNPKRKQKRVGGFEKERDAKKAERDFLQKLENTEIPLDEKSLFSEVITTFLDYIEKSGEYAKGTISNYKGYYKNHLMMFYNMKIKNINIDVIRQWLIGRRENKVSNSVINGCRKLINAAFTHSKHKIRYNPFKDLDKQEECGKLRNRLSVERLREMNKICESEQPDFFCIFCLSYCTGMRLGEYSAINKEDIDFERFTIYVRKQYTRRELKERTKTLGSTREAPFPTSLADVLKWHIRKYNIFSGLMFKGKDGIRPVSDQWVRKQFKQLLVRCGYPADYMRLHDMRGEYVDIMHQNNAPLVFISRSVGHKRTSTTNDIYSTILNKVKTDAMEKLDKAIF